MESMIIYICPELRKSNQFRRIGRKFGFGLVSLSFLFLFLTFGPMIRLELFYRLSNKNAVTTQEIQIEKTVQATIPTFTISDEAKRDLATKEAAQLGVDTNFSLVIPKIDAKAKIIANVDAGNETAYRLALKEGIAHLAGTAFPGEKGTIYLFAHSTDTLANVSRYNAVFYLLKELQPADRITVFYQGLKYEYEVSQRVITDSQDTSWLTPVGEERLILQTCWPPGTIQKRLLVIAKPV